MPERSPLADATAPAGATFAESAGWSLPARFGDVRHEYDEARTGAAVFDLSHRTKVELSGRDRAAFLQSFCTNDVVKLPTGGGCEAYLPTGQGKILARALVFAFPQALWLDAEPGLAAKIINHLNHYLITEDAILTDRTRELAQLHIAGPRAQAVLSAALHSDLPDLPPLWGAELLVEGAGCQVRRTDVLGLPGYDMVCPADHAAAFWRRVVDAGARPAGLEAYDILRVEAGTPEYGRDIDESTFPQEVNRDRQALSFTKGCYLGQETIVRIRDRGHVNRFLVTLQLAQGTPVPAGARVLKDGQEVGRVTSCIVSPRLGAAIALAYVRRGQHAPGTALAVERPDGVTVAAEVKERPL